MHLVPFRAHDGPVDRTSSLVLDVGGTPIVRHVAPPGPAAEALRHEAVVLDRARGLGVVELLEAFDEPDGSAVLSSRFVPGGTLADLARERGAEAALPALARVASILADLHQAGIVHRRCTSEHVVGAGQQIALCGLSQALIGSAEDPPDVADDTEGFALLVEEVCGDDTDRCRRARRAAAGLAGPTPSTNLRVVAAELATLAGLGAPGADGPERVLGPRRSASVAGARRWPPRWRSTPRPCPRAAAAGLVVALGLLAALALGRSGRPDDAAVGDVGPAAPADAAEPGDADEVTETEVAPEARGSRRPPLPVRVWPAPLDEDGATAPSPAPARAAPTPPPEPVGTAAVVVHEGVRYQVGSAGDLVVVGDWDCDGVATASLVRPGDGSVWTFATWAAAGEVVTADALGHAPAPVAAAVVPGADGCDAIAVTTAAGEEVVVDPT